MDQASHPTFARESKTGRTFSRQQKPALPSQPPFVNVTNTAVRSLLEELLLEPTLELRKRPSHQFRAQLVEIGSHLAGSGTAPCPIKLHLCSDAIEFLHLGSLIVDDIQDSSQVRRNGPSLHARLGIPHALSVGNWLYFRALRLLEDLDLSAEHRHLLNREWHEAMELAHYGQVMDLSLSVEQIPLHKVVEVCEHCALYKTGSIVALAISMGALVHGASRERIHAVKKLGFALGVYLQQLNDVGNIVGEFDPEKRFEDLTSRKPSYVWGFALSRFGTQSFDQLLQAARALPDTALLAAWIDRHDLASAAGLAAEKAFDRAVEEFKALYPECQLDNLLKIKDRIKQAYA